MNPDRLQPPDTPPVVLVIDDSPDVHRLLKARLRHEDMRLTTATSAKEGLDRIREEQPALVLLDLDMPEVDGFEVLRRLKDSPETVNIPIIVLSGLQSAHDKVTAFDLGAVDYITKPFNLTELRVRVRSALRMHQLLQMLAQTAHIDGLTGLWNRAHFDRRWADEVSRAARHRAPLSLAMIDVDHFKSINDTYGHPSGDAVLQGLSRAIQRECRQEDIACRYGGEEFALIMPETGPDGGLALSNRIRAAIAAIAWPRHPERTVTISVGLAGFEAGEPHPTAEAWLDAADRALYAAKQGGRNRVAQAGAPVPSGAAPR